MKSKCRLQRPLIITFYHNLAITPNQCDVLSNKIWCCASSFLLLAPWMTVNLHFLIKLAGIFIRGQGYANGNVVYSRLTTDFSENKFKLGRRSERQLNK